MILLLLGILLLPLMLKKMNWRACCPENWRSQGDEIASKSLATGSCFPTNLVILPGGSTVDENRNRAGVGIPRTNGFT